MSRAAGLVSIVAFALLAGGVILFGVAAGVGGWDALGFGVLALGLIALAFAASPAALLLAAAGRGGLTRTALALHMLFSGLGAACAVAVALTGPAESLALRGVAALLAAFCGWGVVNGVRAMRR